MRKGIGSDEEEALEDILIEKVKEATENDSEYQTLKELVKKGFLESIQKVTGSMKKFWMENSF